MTLITLGPRGHALAHAAPTHDGCHGSRRAHAHVPRTLSLRVCPNHTLHLSVSQNGTHIIEHTRRRCRRAPQSLPWGTEDRPAAAPTSATSREVQPALAARKRCSDPQAHSSHDASSDALRVGAQIRACPQEQAFIEQILRTSPSPSPARTSSACGRACPAPSHAMTACT